MIKKILILSIILVLTSLWSFLWKGKENNFDSISAEQWIYVENQKDRSIAFLEFENYSSSRKEDFDSFRTSIPKALAKQMDNITEVDTVLEDYIPVPKNQAAYRIFKINFEEAKKLKDQYTNFVGKSQYQLSKIFGQEISLTNNLSLTNQNASLTNLTTARTNLIADVISRVEDKAEEKDNKKLTRDEMIIEFLTKTKIAYIETNKNEYVYYGYRSPEETYFDAQLINPADLSLLAVPIYTNENQIRFFKDVLNEPKSLKLNDKLFSFNVPLPEVVAKIDADYLVYGRFKVEGINFSLDVFVINKYNDTIKNVFSKKIRSSLIRDEIKQISQYILAYLEGKDLVNNITFTSNPEGARLYLDGEFQGKLPVTLPSMVKKKYNYRVSLERYELKNVRTNLPGREDYLEVDRSGGIVQFNLAPKLKDGRPTTLTVNIENNVLSDFYLNTDLVAVSNTTYSRDLLPGDYYLSLTNVGYETKNIKIQMKEGQDLAIALNMKPTQSDPIADFFFNHARNVKVFSILGFLFSTGTIAVYLQALEAEDRRDEIDRRLTALNSSTLGYNDLVSYRNYLTLEFNNYSITAAGLFGGALLSFLTALISHNFDIWDKRISLETYFEHSFDTRFTYRASVRF